MKKNVYFKGLDFIIRLFITLLIILLIPSNSIDSKAINKSKKFNVLVINTYDEKNEWEHLVLDTVKNKLSDYPQIILNVEYLDIQKGNDKQYLNSFLNLLNLKYQNSEIDAVFTIDDEAFDFVKKNLFNESSIFFKTPIIFSGINNFKPLSEIEKDYITGIVEIENNIELINLIMNLHNNIKEINLILNNATYSNVVKKNLPKIEDFFKSKIKFNIVQGTYIEDVTDELNKIKKDNQANIIVGDFISKNNDVPLATATTIKEINSVISSPIYTKSQPYITNGAVGGIVNLGQEYGKVIANVIVNLYEGSTPRNISIIYGSSEKIVFDYNLLDKYNINPLLLPKDTILVNKGPFDFLLPKSLKISSWFLIIFFIILIISLIYKVIKNKAEYLKQKNLLIQAQESERLKTEFITTVSHELRTPLNIIINSTKLIHNKFENDVIDKNYISNKLDFVLKNSNRLLRLINNVIDLSKVESGYLTVDLEVINIVEIVEDTVMLTVDFAKNQGIDIIFDTEEEEIYTAVDTVKLERVILNLISNAIKFTPSGGSIYVNLYKKQNSILIEVKDTGIGIPKHLLSKIFDRFNQVDTSLTRENEGSGLGLSISKKLVSILNGSLTVTSTEYVGSTFTITLPITKLSEKKQCPSKNESHLEQMVNLELSDIKDKY